MNEPVLRPMAADDFDDVTALWRRSEGVGLGSSDTRERIETYLMRNPGLSQVAETGGHIVGAMLCGHDGRRGFIYHLAVDVGWRSRGLGRRLVEKGLDLLCEQGILKAYIMVFRQNEIGKGFWVSAGWEAREDLIPMCVELEYI